MTRRRDQEEIYDLRRFAAASGLELTRDGFLAFPGTVTHLKIDVGLSWDAVQCLQWLQNDPNLGVIAIEPVPESFNSSASFLEPFIRQGRVVMLQLALSSSRRRGTMYLSAGDRGSSSLYKPKEVEYDELIQVECFTLSAVMHLIDFDRFGYVHYLKTDCQGADLDILVSAGEYLKKVAVITAEAESRTYADAVNSEADIEKYLLTLGFSQINKRSYLRQAIGRVLAPVELVQRLYSKARTSAKGLISPRGSISVEDPTFINGSFASLVYSGKVSAYQKG